MNIFDSIIFGLVEGVTEFLPISSTAHLALTSKLLGLGQTEFMKSFEIVIQFGAILAVVFLYWRELNKNKLWLQKILIAFIPTGVIGLLLYKLIKGLFMSSYHLMVWSLILGGIALIIFELRHKESEQGESGPAELTTVKCLWIGTFQALAVIPGVSRAAATIVGGLLLGIRRKTIVEFSFLLAVPTMFFASSYDLLKNGAGFVADDLLFLTIGFIMSFLVALLAIKYLLGYVRKHNFIPFGVYRIIIGLILIIFIL